MPDMDTDMDFKRLLTKYIRHVEDSEGCNYVDDCGGLDNPGSSVKFTAKEATMLKRIATDLAQERKNA